MARRNDASSERDRTQSVDEVAISATDEQGDSSSYYWWPLEINEIKQAALKIASELRPETIILFGSFAYGTPTRDSDVDLLAVMETTESIHDRFRRVSKILRPRPFPVDILVRTPAELKKSLEMGDSFFREIIDRGTVLYERHPH